MKELLEKFCSEDWVGLTQPFVDGEYTYGCDGHVIIRIKGCFSDNLQKGPSLNKFAGLMDQLPEAGVEVTPSQLWKLRDKYLCRGCEGAGVVGEDLTCNRCEGLKYDQFVYWRLDKNSVIGCLYLGKIIEHLGATEFFPAGLNGEEAIPFKFEKGEGLLMPVKYDDVYRDRVINT